MKKIIPLTLILLIGLIFLLSHIDTKTNSKVDNNISNDEEVTEEIEEDKEDEINEEYTDANNVDDEDNTSNVYNSNKNNMESNNTIDANVINDDSNEESNIDVKQEIKQEESVIETKEEANDNIIDTNSFFYSIHQGNIEMSTEQKCLEAGERIAFIDTVDINYYRCYEVTSTTGKVLGYYLNIYCNSDNCNRYKNEINMSEY